MPNPMTSNTPVAAQQQVWPAPTLSSFRLERPMDQPHAVRYPT
jgi:hypothetical protein